MTKDDIAFLKMHFESFGEDVLERFKFHYDRKGMSFSKVSMYRMLAKLVEEVGEVGSEVFKDKDIKALRSELLDVANVVFMMYINSKEFEDA